MQGISTRILFAPESRQEHNEGKARKICKFLFSVDFLLIIWNLICSMMRRLESEFQPSKGFLFTFIAAHATYVLIRMFLSLPESSFSDALKKVSPESVRLVPLASATIFLESKAKFYHFRNFPFHQNLERTCQPLKASLELLSFRLRVLTSFQLQKIKRRRCVI